MGVHMVLIFELNTGTIFSCHLTRYFHRYTEFVAQLPLHRVCVLPLLH